MTSQPAVERAVVQAILEVVITEHALPGDDKSAQAANRQLAETPWAGQVTASKVETIRLRLGIQRPALAQQLQVASSKPSTEDDPVRLGRTKAGGAFILAVMLVETGGLKAAAGCC